MSYRSHRLAELLARSIEFGAKRAGATPRQIVSKPPHAISLGIQTETQEYFLPIHRIVEEGMKWYLANCIPKPPQHPAEAPAHTARRPKRKRSKVSGQV